MGPIRNSQSELSEDVVPPEDESTQVNSQCDQPLVEIRGIAGNEEIDDILEALSDIVFIRVFQKGHFVKRKLTPPT